MAKTPTFYVVGELPEVLNRHLTDSKFPFVVGTVTEEVSDTRFYVEVSHIAGSPTYLLEVTDGEVPYQGTRIVLSGHSDKGFPEATIVT
jgi:hypothetical protein